MVGKRCWFYDDNAGSSVGVMRLVDHKDETVCDDDVCPTYLY
jgi:hypothetical protein